MSNLTVLCQKETFEKENVAFKANFLYDSLNINLKKCLPRDHHPKKNNLLNWIM